MICFDEFFSKLIKEKRLYAVSNLDHVDVVICALKTKNRRELFDDKFDSISNFPYSFIHDGINIELMDEFPDEICDKVKSKQDNLDFLKYIQKLGYKFYYFEKFSKNRITDIVVYYKYYKKGLK